ncbi:MAG: multicopper oxidase domain-containing protein [Saprospiraceae bacterium]
MKILLFFRNMALAVLLLLLATAAIAQPNFYNEIKSPPLLDAHNGPINLEIQKAFHKFNPGNPKDSLFNGGYKQPFGISTYTYNALGSNELTILGPTLQWYTTESAVITMKNSIGVGTTTHWHGAELPPEMDGGPHQPIVPGTTWTAPNFAVEDSACTMWYHPHLENKTMPHVSLGLSGMILIEQPTDTFRKNLPHHYGVDDIPVIIGDVGISKAPSGFYYLDSIGGGGKKRPFNLVNGVTNPYVNVPHHLVRLRILNGSTRKAIVFGVSKFNNSDTTNLIDFYHVATDGGYTLKPTKLKTLRTGPGNRDEILLDLSGFSAGDTLFLRNLKQLMPGFLVGSPWGSWGGGGGKDSTLGNSFLKLRIIDDPMGYTPAPLNAFKSDSTDWSPGLRDSSLNIHRYRQKVLAELSSGNGFQIDGMSYDMHRIDDTICENTKEIWTIFNNSRIAHPFHIHKIQFRILEARDTFGVKQNLDALGWNGPKDDVLVPPGWRVRFLGNFDDYPRPIDHKYGYMYHCHILTHEDIMGGGMMRQFVVTKEGPCAGSGVDTEADRPSMMLFPNPSTGVLNMKGESARSHNSTLSILDLQGRLIREQNLHHFHGEASIDINGLSNGMYLVTWKTGMGTVTGKLVIQRQ